MIKRFISAFIFLAAVFSLAPQSFALSAKGCALVEANTGRLIRGYNAEAKMPMASTTKIMTGLLACESGKLDIEFSIPREAILVEGSSMGLVEGEKLTLREITYGLLLVSGNDAANVIAFLLGGSINGFAEIMNKRARELGLSGTHFDNPSGLDGKTHYTTALDLARLGAYAMKNEEFSKIASTYVKRVRYNGINEGRYLKNHNELLKTYEGTLGIKTGYTKKSGRCLVTCAERNGVRLVVATLNGWDDWGDHRSLLDTGFNNLAKRQLEIPSEELIVNVKGGVSEKARCFVISGASSSLTADEAARVRFRIDMKIDTEAPVELNQKMGEIIYSLDGAELVRADIVSIDAVAKLTKKNILENILDFFKLGL